jgi:class 3 adenylate cyclase
MTAAGDADIGAWLDALGLGEYAPRFRENDVDLAVVADLTTDDLRELGVTSIGHRRRILAAAESLRATATDGPEPRVASIAERRVVTVMFCDLMDSTALSAKSDPEDYVEFINRFRQELDATIQRFGGNVAQYLGDGVMAHFGYPVASGHDAERAVAAGLAITARVAAMPPFGNHQPRVRVGIATGRTVVGTRDTTLAVQDDSAIGDVPNLAARLQGVADPNTLVISQQTRDLIGEVFDCADLGEVELKGIDEPVRVWRVLGRHASGSRYDALRTARRSPGFVNRTTELDELTRHLAGGDGGRARVAVLVGDPGIGKSRLVQQVIATTADRDGRPLILQCAPYSVGVPFSAIVYFLTGVCGIKTADPPDLTLSRLTTYLSNGGPVTPMRLAVLADLFGIKSEHARLLDDHDSNEIRGLTIALLRDLLQAEIAAGKVLVVEDAQWMDPSSAELLESVLPSIRPRAIVTTHPGALPEWARDTDVAIIELDGLAPLAVEELVVGMADDHVLSADVAATIASRSDGVPLFVEELARGYLDAVANEPGTTMLAEVPISLSESIVARLDRMEHGRRIASIGAAIGREFPIDVLIAVSQLPAAVVHAGVAELEEAQIIAPGQSRFGEAIRFRHNLVRDAAYQLLLRRERTALHARIADTLDTAFPDVAQQLPHMMAIHRSEAGQYERAAAEWERAGQDAASRSAYSEAVGHVANAIASNALLPPSRERDERELTLRLSLMSALIPARGYHAVSVYEETDRVVALSQRLGTSERAIPAMHARWVRLATNNDLYLAREYVFGALEAAANASVLDRLLAHRMCATTLLFSGELQAARDHYNAFLALYDADAHGDDLRAGHSDHVTMVALGLAETYTLLGQRAEADEWRTTAIERAVRSGRIHDQGHTLVFAGCLHPYLMDRHDDVAEHTARLEALIAAHSLPNWQGFAELFRGLVSVRAGLLDEGLASARHGADRLLSIEAYGNWWHLLYAEACMVAGDWATAKAMVAAADAITQRGTLAFEAEARRIEAVIRAQHDGDAAEAARLLDAAEAVADAQGAVLLAERVRRTRDTIQGN